MALRARQIELGNTMAEVHYRLVDTAVRVGGVLTTTDDEYSDTPIAIEDVTVELIHRGAVEGEGQHAVIQTTRGDRDLAVDLTPDGRLRSVDYQSTGVGPSALSLGMKLVGFVGSVLVSPLSAITKSGVPADGHDGPPAAAPRAPKDPRVAWERAHPEAAAMLASNKKLAEVASERLAAIRLEIATSTDLATGRTLAAQEKLIGATLGEARAEVTRLEALYVLWREAQKSVRRAPMECIVELGDIPERSPHSPVSVPPAARTVEVSATSTSAGADRSMAPSRLYEDFRILLEVVDPRRRSLPASQREQWAGLPTEFLRWRLPRPVELWVWKEEQEGTTVLVSRRTVQVTDERSDVEAMELKAALFGESGASWTFHDDGSPASIKVKDTSAAGAIATALSNAPDALVASIEQGKRLTGAVHGIHDIAAEREHAAAERELATANARVELLGVNATARDIASLARAEQGVKLRAANRATSPRAELVDDLKQQLELEKARNDLEAQKRSASIDASFADLRAEIARLEQEVARAASAIATYAPKSAIDRP